MSNVERAQYLARLSAKMSVMYKLPKQKCEVLVNSSPMNQLLEKDAEMVMHEQLSSWAELIYESQH